MMDIEVKKLAYRRNGIVAVGFYVVAFDYTGDDGQTHEMVGVVFNEPGHVAVFDARALGMSIIESGKNSFRGDVFEEELRGAIKEYEEALLEDLQEYRDQRT